MRDLIERLRSPEIALDVAAKYLCVEAAEEIERLRAEQSDAKLPTAADVRGIMASVSDSEGKHG